MPSENNKRIAKNTLYLYFRMLLSMGVSLYTSRIVLDTLGFEDYGIYSVVGGVVALFGFLNASMSGATLRFLTYALGEGDKKELQKTFSAALTIHILIAVLILVLAETAGLWFLENKLVITPERMNAARAVYQLSIFSAMVSIMQVPYNAIIIAHERMNVYAYVEILNVCLKLGIVYLLVISHWDKLILYAALIFVVSLFIAGIYQLYCIKHFEESKYKIEWNKKIIYPMLNYSGWSLFGCGAVIGATQGVNIILNLFFGPVVNAARGIAVQVNGVITSFVNNFQTAVNPQIVKLYAGEKITELHILLFQNSKFSFCIMWILSLPVFLKLDVILNIWLVDVPEHTSLFCILILLQAMIYCMQYPLVMACHAIGKMRIFQLLTTPVLLLILPLSYLMLKMNYPVYVPFILYIIMTVIEFMIELFLLKRWINLPSLKFFKIVIWPVFIVIITSFPLPFLLSILLNDIHTLVSFFIICTLSVLNAMLSIYYFALDKSLRIKLQTIILTKIISK